MEHDIEKAPNMKLTLCIFQELTRLQIKFYKSIFFCFSPDKVLEDQYRNCLVMCSI
jgi:hypothetical protein